MVPEAGPKQKEAGKRKKMALEGEPETKKLGNKSMRLQKQFYLFLIICLLQLILKLCFAELILDS